MFRLYNFYGKLLFVINSSLSKIKETLSQPCFILHCENLVSISLEKKAVEAENQFPVLNWQSLSLMYYIQLFFGL
jgi:hypothetical protein